MICNADWLKTDSRSSQIDTITVTASANTGNSGRTAIVTIKTREEQTVTVNQASPRSVLCEI